MDLGKKLREALAKLTNRPYVDEDAVKALLKDIQRVLIAGDVNVKLVLELTKKIERRTLSEKKLEALSLREHVLKVVYEELVNLMGISYSPILNKHKILLVGLYGSGKTTSTVKIANFYRSRGLSVAVVAADVERPAAQEQLEQLAEKTSIKFYTIKKEKNAARIVEEAVNHSKEDVIIVDSAGRSAFDEKLADELRSIYTALKPEEIFLILSADIGQIASKQAEEFNKIIPITGVCISKMDGSGKGGGALSAVASVGARTAFIGTGEKTEDLELYDAKRFVGRLLGVPDIAALMEKVQKIAESEKLPEATEEFNIKTFYEQLKAAKKLGPLSSVFSMLGAADIPKEMVQQSEGKLKKFEAMIQSMTETERKNASLLKSHGRIARIAAGSGCTEKEVKEFIAQFEKMEKMLGMFKNNRGFRSQMEKLMKGGFKGLKM